MKRIIYFLIAAAALSGCSSADIDLFDSPMHDAGAGTLTAEAATVSTLSFSWQAIEGVNQYGYTLLDADGAVQRQGITRSPSVDFEKLEPATTYTLIVEAFGANGRPTERFSLQAVTDPVVRLATPNIDAIEVTMDNGIINISWPEIDGADSYTYAIYLPDTDEPILEGTVDANCIEVRSLPAGQYVIELTADAEYEGYLTSETASGTFTRQRMVSAEYQGIYTSYVLGTFQCTLRQYDDGSYSILSFLGVDGYNLEFSVNRNAVTILNATVSDGKYRTVPTGRTDYAEISIYEDSSYSTYRVLPTGKQLRLFAYLGDSTDGGYDTFVWK